MPQLTSAVPNQLRDNMLPSYIDPNNPHRFVINDSRGFHVGFFRFDPHGSPRPLAGHWIRECGDKPSRDAMVRWLTIRRSKWHEWGRLAELLGPDAFARHMEQAMTAEPIEPVVATTVQKLSDPREVALGEMLAGSSGLRTETLYVHRFGSPDMRQRFLDWFTDKMSEKSAALVKIAYDRGTAALSKTMDDLGAPPKAARRREVKERRRAVLLD